MKFRLKRIGVLRIEYQTAEISDPLKRRQKAGGFLGDGKSPLVLIGMTPLKRIDSR